MSLPHYSIEASKLEVMKALNGTFLALSCIVVALRVWTRTRISRCWGYDDWFMLLTLVGIVILERENHHLTLEQVVFIGECTVWLMLADTEGKPTTLANLNTYAAVSIIYLHSSHESNASTDSR